MAGITGKHKKNKRSNREMKEGKKLRRSQEDKPLTFIGFLIRIGIIVGVFFLMYIILSNSGMDVKKIEVVGNNVISDEDVISLSGVSVGDELFKTDVVGSENQILMHVMIDEVNVRVRPFDKVLIEITEKNAVAGFIVDDVYFYLDAEKVVVAESDTVDEILPLFSGFTMPSFVSIGLPLEDPLLDSDLKIAEAMKGRFDDYALEICAVSDSVNNVYLNGIEVRLGSLSRLGAKIDALDALIHSMSVQKLESLEYIDISLPDEPVLKERPLGELLEGEEEDDEGNTSKTKKPASPDPNRKDTSEAE